MKQKLLNIPEKMKEFICLQVMCVGVFFFRIFSLLARLCCYFSGYEPCQLGRKGANKHDAPTCFCLFFPFPYVFSRLLY